MERALALATDLYELTMAAGYFVSGVTGTATFELFVRALPRNRQFLIAVGLKPVLEYLDTLRFTAEDIDYLRRRKQVWRRDAGGAYIDDLVARIDEPAPPAAEPLLVCVMRNGRRIAPAPPLSETRAFCRACVDRLPEALHALDGESAYPVRISEPPQTRSTELPAGRAGSTQ